MAALILLLLQLGRAPVGAAQGALPEAHVRAEDASLPRLVQEPGSRDAAHGLRGRS